jgi:rhodanese-related sulfurtransferase
MSGNKQYILIDIRSDAEVYNKHIDTTTPMKFMTPGVEYSVYMIPMNMIRFNRENIINHLQWVDKIFIVCNSGRRSKFIKDKYFADQPNIIYDNHLQFNYFKEAANIISVQVDGETISFNIPVAYATDNRIYSITRLVQIMLGIVIILTTLGTIYQLGGIKTRGGNIIWGLGIVLAFGIMALYNGLYGTCTMSLILEDYLN